MRGVSQYLVCHLLCTVLRQLLRENCFAKLFQSTMSVAKKNASPSCFVLSCSTSASYCVLEVRLLSDLITSFLELRNSESMSESQERFSELDSCSHHNYPNLSMANLAVGTASPTVRRLPHTGIFVWPTVAAASA